MPGKPDNNLICILDDDAAVRDSLETLLRSADHQVRGFSTPEEFLAFEGLDATACLVLDIHLGQANGLDFQEEFVHSAGIPVILISGQGDIPIAVRGMRAGALTFLTKPFDDDVILAAIGEAVALDRANRQSHRAREHLDQRHASLTPREKDVFGLVTAGLMNKQIAGRLNLSEITVKIHRGNMMKKMQADSLADLVRMAETLGVKESASRYGKS